jgi:hypothetical protein
MKYVILAVSAGAIAVSGVMMAGHFRDDRIHAASQQTSDWILHTAPSQSRVRLAVKE